MLRGLKTFDPAEIEEKVLEFWKANAIFEKSLKQRQQGESKSPGSALDKTFKFYEGPPYANGRPGIHHVLARVFKDIILRYKSMRGFYVPRKAGWDTHGLPIELEAEKQLGIKSKREIEKFGIALFNQKAKESVWQYKDEWERMTERIGYWLDLKNAYITYENPYMESLWWVFKEVAKKGLLKKNYKIVPYCPRCQTPLASHELGMPGVYKKVPDPSVYVKFKLKTKNLELIASRARIGHDKKKIDEYLLVWTTTPWTLPSNVAVALDPKLTYTKFAVTREGKKEFIWSYNAPPALDGVRVEVVEKISGKKLLDLEYEPLYVVENTKFDAKKFYKVLSGDFVKIEEGTGLVHIAPAFGEEDLNLIKSWDKEFNWQGVPVTVDDSGAVIGKLPGAGKFIKGADEDIIADLTSRGLMYASGKIEHEYPFCWRCSTPLIYFARLSWFLEMSKLRDKLIAANGQVNWIPEHIKEGRFGEWLREVRDWSISRDRYWGTPLPIWECVKCAHNFVAGSLADIESRPFYKNNFFLVRHTEAEHNIKNILAAGPEKGNHISRLTAKGVADAKKLAEDLRGKKIDVIYTSPYKRAREVAAIIAKETKAKVIADERLSEINCGIFNWRPVKEHKKFFSSPLQEFTKTPPEGENLNDVKKRSFHFLREVNEKYRDKNILIVGHGDSLWMLEAASIMATNEEALTLSYFEPGDVRPIKLRNVPANDLAEIDMHRPFIDRIYRECDKCHSKMIRVKEVADVWFDSGAMPFASHHYPFKNDKSVSEVPGFPADYICEAIDQTRGWFYTLLAVSVMLGKKSPYKNVICLGLILDKHGIKMSKSKGNIVNPWEIMQKYGVDSVRWYFYTVNPPGEPKLFDEAEVGKTMRRVFFILYNSFVFFETYGKRSKDTKEFMAEPKSKNILDKWIIARKDQAASASSKHLEGYHVGEAAKEIESLLDDLSRWYIRRSRRRFQKPSSEKDLKDASKTLEFMLFEMSRLIAPFAPFFAEALYLSLCPKGKGVAESVHLLDWPEAKMGKSDALIAGMQAVRDMATKALAKRAEAGIKVRQPLQSVRCQVLGIRLDKELLEILKDEINVKEVFFDKNLKSELVELDTKITPALREEGMLRDVIRAVQELRQGAGYTPKDKIELYVSAGRFDEIISRYEGELKKEVGAKTITLKKTDKFDAEITTKLDGEEVWLAVKKIK